eukprot:11509800-Alexandrium_andersonii.AAC.1
MGTSTSSSSSSGSTPSQPQANTSAQAPSTPQASSSSKAPSTSAAPVQEDYQMQGPENYTSEELTTALQQAMETASPPTSADRS